MRKWRDHIRAKKELILEEMNLGTSLKGGIRINKDKGSARIEILVGFQDCSVRYISWIVQANFDIVIVKVDSKFVVYSRLVYSWVSSDFSF